MADQEFQMVLDLVDNASEVIDTVKDKLTDLMNSAGPTGKAIATVGRLGRSQDGRRH